VHFQDAFQKIFQRLPNDSPKPGIAGVKICMWPWFREKASLNDGLNSRYLLGTPICPVFHFDGSFQAKNDAIPALSGA